jgi:hypothetical protein
MYVSSYCYICVLIQLYMCPHTLYMCPHTTIYVSSYCYICVLIQVYMCPHTAMYLSSCPHATIYVSSSSYICTLLLYVSSYSYTMCPHTTTMCVLILLYHTYSSILLYVTLATHILYRYSYRSIEGHPLYIGGDTYIYSSYNTPICYTLSASAHAVDRRPRQRSGRETHI